MGNSAIELGALNYFIITLASAGLAAITAAVVCCAGNEKKKRQKKAGNEDELQHAATSSPDLDQVERQQKEEQDVTVVINQGVWGQEKGVLMIMNDAPDDTMQKDTTVMEDNTVENALPSIADTRLENRPQLKNMETIQRAGVKVKDKVKVFQESAAPIAQDLTRRLPRNLNQQPKSTVPNLELASQENNSTGKYIESNRRKSALMAEALAMRTDEQREKQRLPREGNAVDYESVTNVGRPVRSEVTESRRGSQLSSRLTDFGRTDTLQYFNKLRQDHTVLKAFEKAKPARHQRKERHGERANMELDNRTLPAAKPWGSDLDLTTPAGRDNSVEVAVISNGSNADSLVSINNKTRQPYAMDDMTYETLKRKKIAGLHLPIGPVDYHTEKNFLLSLKRNSHFKAANRHHHGAELEELSF